MLQSNPRGRELSEVTLSPDQLFLLGDNRDQSVDDRFGVPTDQRHLVGRALFVWFSYSALDGVRWSRIGLRL